MIYVYDKLTVPYRSRSPIGINDADSEGILYLPSRLNFLHDVFFGAFLIYLSYCDVVNYRQTEVTQCSIVQGQSQAMTLKVWGKTAMIKHIMH